MEESPNGVRGDFNGVRGDFSGMEEAPNGV
jgi:hypothetical protein